MLGPPDVVTVTSRDPSVASAAIVNVVVMDVLLTTVIAPTVTPAPVTPTVAPVTKFVPVNVTGTAVPCTPDEGFTKVNVGGGGFTVKVTALLVPAEVVTVMSCGPSIASDAIVRVVVIVVLLTTTAAPIVTPVPIMVADRGPTRFVPVSVTGTTVPCCPDDGFIDVSVGGPALTVKLITLTLVPPLVVTVTRWFPSVASDAMTKFATIVVGLVTLVGVAVIPEPASMVFALRPGRKFVPVSVTLTVVP